VNYTKELLELMETRARLTMLRGQIEKRIGREKRYTDKVKFLERDSARLESEITHLSASIREIEPHCKPIGWNWFMAEKPERTLA
jgi:hypothetical protein